MTTKSETNAMHIRAALFGFLILMVACAIWLASTPLTAAQQVVLVVQHDSPSSLLLRLVRSPQETLIHVAPESTEQVRLSTPDNWERKQVSHVPLSSVTSETGLGYATWTLPPSARVTYLAPVLVGSMILRNESDSPLRLRISSKQHDEQASVTQEYLIDDEKEIDLSRLESL